MKYFVTGATGFLGGHLVRQLLDRGDEVVALIRSETQAQELPASVTTAVGDVTDKDSMREPMRGVDGVFHLAAWYRVGVDAVETAERVNVGGTRNVLELMDELAIPKGVYTSSLAVFSDTRGQVVDESYRYDGPHVSVYDRTKWQAHYEVAEPMIKDGLPLVIVQPGSVYGPGDRGPTWLLWRSYFEGDLPVIPKRSGYCWGHVEDTMAAHIAAMERGVVGESYIIAGEPCTLVDVFDMAEAATGIDAPQAVNPGFFRIASRIAGGLERIVSLPPEYAPESLRVLGGVTYWGDNEKATRELGLDHRPVADGLGDTLRYELERIDG